MSATEEGTRPPGTVVGGGVVGAVSGTLVVRLATELPDDNVYKPWLLLLAPTISVVGGTLTSLLIREATRQWNKHCAEREAKRLEGKFKSAAADPRISKAQRTYAQGQLDELQRLVWDNEKNALKKRLEKTLD